MDKLLLTFLYSNVYLKRAAVVNLLLAFADKLLINRSKEMGLLSQNHRIVHGFGTGLVLVLAAVATMITTIALAARTMERVEGTAHVLGILASTQ